MGGAVGAGGLYLFLIILKTGGGMPSNQYLCAQVSMDTPTALQKIKIKKKRTFSPTRWSLQY